MNLYVGQEITAQHNSWFRITISEIILHRDKQTARASCVSPTNNYPDVFITIEFGRYNIENVRELEDYLPSLAFDLEETYGYFLTLVMGFYGCAFNIKNVTKNLVESIIESKEDYLHHYGGILKLLDLYETYEKRIDHIIKTLVLLLHFDLTKKKKICN